MNNWNTQSTLSKKEDVFEAVQNPKEASFILLLPLYDGCWRNPQHKTDLHNSPGIILYITLIVFNKDSHSFLNLIITIPVSRYLLVLNNLACSRASLLSLVTLICFWNDFVVIVSSFIIKHNQTCSSSNCSVIRGHSELYTEAWFVTLLGTIPPPGTRTIKESHFPCGFILIIGLLG